jgi:hypothetical protein
VAICRDTESGGRDTQCLAAWVGGSGEGLVHFAARINSVLERQHKCVCTHATWLSSEVRITDVYNLEITAWLLTVREIFFSHCYIYLFILTIMLPSQGARVAVGVLQKNTRPKYNAVTAISLLVEFLNMFRAKWTTGVLQERSVWILCVSDHSITWAEHKCACNVNQTEWGELIKKYFSHSTSVTSVKNSWFIFYKFVIELIQKKGI